MGRNATMASAVAECTSMNGNAVNAGPSQWTLHGLWSLHIRANGPLSLTYIHIGWIWFFLSVALDAFQSNTFEASHAGKDQIVDCDGANG